MGAQTVTNNVEVFSLDVLPVRRMSDVRYCLLFIFSLNTQLCQTSAYKLPNVNGVPGGPVVDEVVPVPPLLSNIVSAAQITPLTFTPVKEARFAQSTRITLTVLAYFSIQARVDG